jgi:hypothetical protein
MATLTSSLYHQRRSQLRFHLPYLCRHADDFASTFELSRVKAADEDGGRTTDFVLTAVGGQIDLRFARNGRREK